MKLTKLDEHGYSADDTAWIASPLCQNPTELENLLIQRRDELDLIATVDDDTLSYEYSTVAVVKLENDYYLLHTSGCSCPSPNETWSVEIGPSTIKEIKNYVKNEVNMYLPDYIREKVVEVLTNAVPN